MIGYIYITTNNINGMKYIGKRKKDRFLGNKYLGSGKYLKEAIAVYGSDNFSVELLCECETIEELNEKEIYYIDKYNAQYDSMFYNIAKGGEAGIGGDHFRGHHHTDETRRKMSESRTGSKNSNFGNRWKQSDELKKKHSLISSGSGNGMYGKHHSEETKKLIADKNRESMTGRIGISKDGVKKFVKKHDLEKFLELGWNIGFK